MQHHVDSSFFAAMEQSPVVTKGSPRRRGPVFTFASLTATAWTLAFLISVSYNVISADQRTIEAAKLQARTIFETDLLYQNWLSNQRGIYTPASETVLPNPYLKEDIRTIPLPDGQTLVNVSPDYMFRLVNEKDRNKDDIISHMTSNAPIRLQNRPDPWEAESLRLLETTLVEEVSEIQTLNGREYLRFMAGRPAQDACLVCHISTTAQPPNIIGGISVSVPMGLFVEGVKSYKWTLFVTHLMLWLLGIVGIFFATRTLIVYLEDRDRTERDLFSTKEAVERRERELAAFVNNVDAGVFLKDPEGRFIVANKRLCKIFGLPKESILGKSNDELMGARIGRQISAHEQEVLATAKAIEAKDALPFYDLDKIYSCFIFPVLDSEHGKAISVGGLIVDMTERERTEQAIRQARDAAEQANVAKSNFLANTSHEIRTPLNGLIGMSDLLLRTHLSADQASMVSAIKSSGDALLAVINDILDISKITAGKMLLESVPFDLRDVLYDAVKGLTPVAYEKELELILHVSPQVPEQIVGDPLRLRQIVLNLVVNAMKFTQKGEVLVSVQAMSAAEHLPDGVRLRFSVTDTGIGIPLDMQEKIFHAFEQVDSSTTRKYGGTGLGLAICSRLLDMMGSKMKLESSEGFGSTFWFVIDFAVPPRIQTPLPPVAPDPLNGVEALVVDTNKTNLTVLSETLTQWGMKVTRAISVSEALEALSTRLHGDSPKPFDIILTDSQVLDLGGCDLLRQLKDRPDQASTPLILLSSGFILDCQEMGNGAFDAVLDKPVRPSRLRGAILSALQKTPAEDLPSTTMRIPPLTSPKSLKVLLVEDVKMNQMVATRMLAELGHTCVIAPDGKEAVDLVQDNGPFDVILMDVQMPVMDGVQATRLIRRMEEDGRLSPRNIIIGMTANAFKEDIATYMDAGMDTSLTKPVLLDDLKRVLDLSVFGAGVPSQTAKPREASWFSVHGAPSHPPEKPSDPLPVPEVNEPEDENLINWLILKRNFGSNTDFLLETMRIYLRDAPRLLEEVNEAIKRGDNEALNANAHALKGITGYFNRASVLEACLRLEKWGRDRSLPEDREALEKDYQNLTDLMDQLVKEIKTYISGASAGQEPNGN